MIERTLERHKSLFGCLAIIVGIFLCSGVSFFAVDRVCHAALSQRLPLYPGAEVRSRTHNLFSEFGMGNTVIVLYSEDEPDVVRSFYGRAQGAYTQTAVRSRDWVTTAGLRVSRADWSVVRDSDGVGSQIILFGTCVN